MMPSFYKHTLCFLDFNFEIKEGGNLKRSNCKIRTFDGKSVERYADPLNQGWFPLWSGFPKVSECLQFTAVTRGFHP